MKVVVTGGSGQLGTLVLERLISSRKIKKIVSLDLVPPRLPSPKLDYRIADLKDPGLERHLEGADGLIHLAFIVTGRESPELMRAVNVEGSRRLFEAAAVHHVRRIVYCSSIAAYGLVDGHPVPIVESTPRAPTPDLLYANNKWEVEDYLDRFEPEHPEVSVVRLRPGILLGRRPSHLDSRLVRRRVAPVVSGTARPVVVWDEDVAEAVMLALLSDARGAYNLAADEPISTEDLARLAGFRVLRVPRRAASAVARVSSVVKPLASGPWRDEGWIRAGQVEQVVSSEKARRELGWKPHYPTAADVAIAFGKHARGRPDPRLRFFMKVVAAFARRARDEGEIPREGRLIKLRIHLDIVGKGGDDFDLALDKGTLTLRRGIPRPPDAAVTLSLETFLALLSGTVTPATAGIAGKMRVRGEPLAGMVVTGIVNGFRSATARAGPSGRVARGLARWFAKGTT